MATLTKTQLQGAYGAYAADDALVTFQAASISGDVWNLKEGDILLAHNTGASPYWIQIFSVDDEYGRQEHIGDGSSTYELAADEIHAFGPFKNQGWRDSNGQISIDVENAAIEVAVINT